MSLMPRYSAQKTRADNASAKNDNKPKGSGRGKWQVGEKLHETMVLHRNYKFLAKYPAQPIRDNSGNSSAKWEGLGEPMHHVTIDALGEFLTAEKTELINRPAVGWSTLTQCLEV